MKIIIADVLVAHPLPKVRLPKQLAEALDYILAAAGVAQRNRSQIEQPARGNEFAPPKGTAFGTDVRVPQPEQSPAVEIDPITPSRNRAQKKTPH